MALAQKEGVAKGEGWRLRKDGSTFWGSILITAIHNEGQKVIDFTKVTRDLTAIKKAEDANELNQDFHNSCSNTLINDLL